MADRFVHVRGWRRDGGVSVVEDDLHPIARPFGQTGGRAQVLDLRLQVAARGGLARGASLDLIELRAQVGELLLQDLLFALERPRGVEQRRVVADA